MVGRSSNGGGGLWRLADEMNPPEVGSRAMEAECVRRFHRHEPKENQCSSSVVKHIKAPVHLVISLSSFFGFEIGGLLVFLSLLLSFLGFYFPQMRRNRIFFFPLEV